jgi:hypothetical protein
LRTSQSAATAGAIGSTAITSRRSPGRLTDAEAEATTLHEAAHWRLGHEDEHAGDYESARGADEAAGLDHHRGDYELAANALATEWIEDLRDTGLLTDPDASLRFLAEDDKKYT